jgi:hypothetical protein
VYLKPIRERGLLDQQDISAIFSNVEQLLILNQVSTSAREVQVQVVLHAS